MLAKLVPGESKRTVQLSPKARTNGTYLWRPFQFLSCGGLIQQIMNIIDVVMILPPHTIDVLCAPVEGMEGIYFESLSPFLSHKCGVERRFPNPPLSKK